MSEKHFKQHNRTELEQSEVVQAIDAIYKIYDGETYDKVQLQFNKYFNQYELLEKFYEIAPSIHTQFSFSKLINVGRSIMGLDVGQPWCVYWPLNSIEILKETDISKYHSKIISLIRYCQNQSGGFGGGHVQVSHLAPTYSAILSLLLVGTEEAYQVIDRQKLQEFFYKVRNPNYKGSYLMHENGESDMRAVYIVVIMTLLLRLDPQLLDGCSDYVSYCQTYEGGIGATPYSESHGGYAYCGFAALVAMDKGDSLNQQKLLMWLVNRQMEAEGGFNGRTNKVVDSCYTFWQGAIFDLINISSKGAAKHENELLVDSEALHGYVQICQSKQGGFFDKPGKGVDAYHTCYSLSGVAVTQSSTAQDLVPVDPIYNIPKDKLQKARDYFNKLEVLKL